MLKDHIKKVIRIIISSIRLDLGKDQIEIKHDVIFAILSTKLEEAKDSQSIS